MRVSNVAINILIAVVTLTNESTSFSITETPAKKVTLTYSETIAYKSKLQSRRGHILYATVENSPHPSDVTHGNNIIISGIKEASVDAKQWAEEFDLVNESCDSFYALFSGIRGKAILGLKGSPFYLNGEELSQIMNSNNNEPSENPFRHYFTFDDLSKALEDDFLDANRGSTDNRQGWKVTAVSTPRGSSFEDARMTLDDVNVALEKGTVIFNTAGSHIPKLAGATLACTDASSLPCAVNMYVTAAGKRTSAPPHTDRQDVIVVQTQGKKRWRVYSPPDPSLRPNADMYARGKGDDSLPLYSLEEGNYGCKKLMDVITEAGDVLFIPAAFPHTTDTVTDLEVGTTESTSIHLTFNFDTHVWDLNYLSARRLALRRAGVKDTALGQEREEDNRYVGNVNLLPRDVRSDLMTNLPLTFLEENDAASTIDHVTAELKRISQLVDESTYDKVPSNIWKETIERIRVQGIELLDIHRFMYLEAINEGRERKAEEAMTAHLTRDALARARALTPEKIQRLSLFRVQKFFEQINESKKSLVEWSFAGVNNKGNEGSLSVPENWEFTSPLRVGDQVEADLGGAFFPATVTKAGNLYDVKFFDGDSLNGISRDMIKLLTPPAFSNDPGTSSGEEPPPGLTKKELKRWLKKQEKKANVKGF